ncbi:MAG: hypothetical protein LBK07_04255 [Tannerella sp.]|jgi:hypothetical protein|nr:hypothetical protein [Tannerella sp.]
MTLFGLTLTTLAGLCLALCISQRLKPVELLGLAFPLGMGAQTFLMVCLDWAGVGITVWPVLAATLAMTAAAGAYLYTIRRRLAEWWRDARTFDPQAIGAPWLLCVALIATVAVMNVTKTMYFPTFDTDSVRGYDLIGMAAGREGTLKALSLFTDPNYAMRGAASYISYPPFSQLAYAWVYTLGAATSKIVNALIFLSFILIFYGVTRRFVTPLAAALATLFVIVTPEMLGFSSMSGINFTHALFASAGLLYFIAWYYRKIPSLLWISAALLMLNVWTRSEGPAFVAAACTVLLVHDARHRRLPRFALYAALCAFPFIFYTLFLKAHHLEAESVLITTPFWDGAKLAAILREEWALLTNTTYYGLTFIALALAALAAIPHLCRHRDHAVTLLLLLLVIILCTALIYQLRLVWDSLEAIMRYSYKRLIFTFVPLAWFYIFANRNVAWLFDRADRFIHRRAASNRRNP